jgi:hypothetical protein
MIRMFGEDAEIRAAMRADALLSEGDVEGCSLWKQIAGAIAGLQRSAPAPGERVH